MVTTWKGSLRIAQLSIPINLQSAIDSRAGVHSHLIHTECGQRIKQYRRCDHCDATLSPDQIAKGYQVENGGYVILSPEEITAVLAEDFKEITIEGFTRQLNPSYTDRPYFVSPEGLNAIHAITIFRKAIGTSRIGLGKMNLRGKSVRVALLPKKMGFMLHTLRPSTEVREQPMQIELKVAAEDVKLAKKLIDKMMCEPQWESYVNEHEEALRKLITAKAEGKQYVRPIEQQRTSVADMKEALRKSLQEVA